MSEFAKKLGNNGTSSQNGGSATADEKSSKVEVVFGKNFYNFMCGKI